MRKYSNSDSHCKISVFAIWLVFEHFVECSSVCYSNTTNRRKWFLIQCCPNNVRIDLVLETPTGMHSFGRADIAHNFSIHSSWVTHITRWTLDPASRVRFPLPVRKSTPRAMNKAAHVALRTPGKGSRPSGWCAGGLSAKKIHCSFYVTCPCERFKECFHQNQRISYNAPSSRFARVGYYCHRLRLSRLW